MGQHLSLIQDLWQFRLAQQVFLNLLHRQLLSRLHIQCFVDFCKSSLSQQLSQLISSSNYDSFGLFFLSTAASTVVQISHTLGERTSALFGSHWSRQLTPTATESPRLLLLRLLRLLLS